MRYIDLRSDTVTQPTQEMREAMANAVVGDDIYGDDPTMKELEEYAAKLVDKEAALFVPSGIFGNQLSIFTHCKRGDEVILDENCHIIQHEVGAASVIAGVQLRTLSGLSPSEVEGRIRRAEDDLQYPGTGLICVENAHSNGKVISLEIMKEIYEIAQKNELPVHLDGARVFNAAAYLGIEVNEITKYCDSVMFCLSKGLCAPVGSILAGSKKFIDKARKKRRLMGGALRQGGILAAAGLVALKKMRGYLKIDHENAVLLGDELSKIEGVKVRKEDIHINMVFFSIKDTGCSGEKFVESLYSKGIKSNGEENGEMRFVTNYWVSKEDVSYIVKCVKEILSEK